MWAVDVDVVHGCGHVVDSCVTVVVVCIVLWAVCVICRSYALFVGGMHCLWAASSLGGRGGGCFWVLSVSPFSSSA